MARLLDRDPLVLVLGRSLGRVEESFDVGDERVYLPALCHLPRSVLARCPAGQSMNWSSGTKVIGSRHEGHRIADLITDQPCPVLSSVSTRARTESTVSQARGRRAHRPDRARAR